MDPVKFFSEANNLPHVLETVFMHLDMEDLVASGKVSSSWKAFVDSNIAAKISFGDMLARNAVPHFWSKETLTVTGVVDVKWGAQAVGSVLTDSGIFICHRGRREDAMVHTLMRKGPDDGRNLNFWRCRTQFEANRFYVIQKPKLLLLAKVRRYNDPPSRLSIFRPNSGKEMMQVTGEKGLNHPLAIDYIDYLINRK